MATKRASTGSGSDQSRDAVIQPAQQPSQANHNNSDSDTPPTVDEKGRMELTEDDAYEKLGFMWPASRKWTIITVIFIVQCSMNFNASVYANAVSPIASDFGISEQAARVGQCVFLIAYAFGCELWAPWSEEIGRWPVLQASLGLVNIWQIMCALAPNLGTIIVGRFLGGISSAGGSVTLGMVADMWEPANQQFAVAFVVLSSVGGSVLGPIFGGMIQQWLDWRWNFWIQLIFGVCTQVLHFFIVPETRVTIILDKEAKRMRKTGENPNIYGPNEIKGPLFKRLTPKELITIWVRPFRMFLTEPIVLCLSLLSGFSDALIFTFLDGFSPVFKQWNFTDVAQGLAFVSILVGYFIAYFSFMPFFLRDKRFMAKNGPESLVPERRLIWLLYLAPLEAIGIFGFAWTSFGPSHGIPWIAPLIFASFIGIANYAIYMATIDYMVAAYGPYAASATGGNGFARDFLAGVAAMYSTPFYSYFKKDTLELPSTILGCIAIVVTIPIYIFYVYGAPIRERSKFAQTLAGERIDNGGRRASKVVQGDLAREDQEKANLQAETQMHQRVGN